MVPSLYVTITWLSSHVTILLPVKWPPTIGKLYVKILCKSRQKGVMTSWVGVPPLTGLFHFFLSMLRVNKLCFLLLLLLWVHLQKQLLNVDRYKSSSNCRTWFITVFTLSIQTNRFEQTVYTQIKCHTMWHLIRIYTVCHLSSSFWQIHRW